MMKQEPSCTRGGGEVAMRVMMPPFTFSISRYLSQGQSDGDYPDLKVRSSYIEIPNAMITNIKHYRIPTWLRVIIIVPVCVFAFVGASSYFLGPGRPIIGIFICWFIAVPLLNVFLSKTISGKEHLAVKSLVSLIVFYGVMVFMIYKHYQTDFFKLMIASLIFNSFAILLGLALVRSYRNAEE